MPTYKLFYYNARGSAELPRFIFAQADVKYQDVRLEGEKWQEMRASTPFGVLPVLEVDGKLLGGSLILGRYLAEQHGLAGGDPFENAQIANIVDAVHDINMKIHQVFVEKDEVRRAELRKKLTEVTLPKIFSFFEKRASTNDHGWLAGKLTWADFAFYLSLERLTKLVSDALNDYPEIKKMHASVEALPKIAKWMKERPYTSF